MTKSKLTTLLIGLLTAFIVTGFTGSGFSAKGQEIALGMLPIEDNLPFYVAAKQGIFAKHGVEVKLIPFASAVERDTALRAGAIDGMLADMVAALMLEGTGSDISIISLGLGATAKEGRFALLAAPDSSVRSIRDLKGQKVGISTNTIVEYVLDSLVAKAGIKDNDIGKLEIAKLPVRVEMLLSGQLKAAVLPDPMAAYAQAKGAKLIADDTKVNISQTVILFRKASLKGKAESVKAFMDAYKEAVSLVNSSPEDFRGLLVEIANIPESIKKTYPIDNWPEPQLPSEDEVKAVADWMTVKDLLKNKISYDRLVDGGYLPRKRK